MSQQGACVGGQDIAGQDVRDLPPKPDRERAETDGRLFVGDAGEMRFSPTQSLRWGMSPGAEFLVRETPDGLLLEPRDPVLSKVYVEPTSACNLACRTCMRRSWNEPVGTMEMNTYRRLVEGLREVPSLRKIAFWGLGEPLLHPQIVEMVAQAKALGAKTEIVTNGLLLQEGVARELVAVGLDTLVISVDGASQEAYENIRSGADLQQVQKNIEVLRAIRRANSRGNPEIGIEFVVMRRNLGELPRLPQLAYAMGASFVVVSNLLPYTEELQDEILYGLWAGRSYLPQRSRRMPEVLLPRIDARREVVEPIMSLMYHTDFAQSSSDRLEEGNGYCRFVREGAVAVSWDGALSPCIALMHSYECYVMRRQKRILRYTLGNVAQEGIARLWHSPEYVAFRDRVRRFDFAPCSDCGGCNLAESNEQDCVSSTFPVCGDCLWAKGVIQCP